MDWVIIIGYVIGFIIIWIYQREQNKTLRQEVKSLRGMLEDQKTVVDTIKSFKDIFDAEDFRQYVQMKVEIKDMEIGKITKEFQDKITQRDEKGKIVTREYMAVASTMVHLLSITPLETRVQIIQQMKDSFSKEALKQIDFIFKARPLRGRGTLLTEKAKDSG